MILLNLLLVVTAISCGMPVRVFVYLLRRIISPARFAPFSLEWLNAFTAERYRAMGRLLAEDDYRFLAGQSVKPKAIRSLRAQRRRIFRGYLNEMRHDFSRICDGIKLFMVSAPQDRPDLAILLIKQQM